MRPAILSAILAAASAALGPAHSALAETPPKVSLQLAGRSVQCGAGSALYFDPDLRTVSVIDGADGPFPIAENRTALEPPRIKADDGRRFDVVLTTAAGETRFRFERRDGISLHVDDDAVGDACVLAEGRAEFVVARFNMIREGVCGNDPKPSCEAGLAKRCGPAPDEACVRALASPRK